LTLPSAGLISLSNFSLEKIGKIFYDSFFLFLLPEGSIQYEWFTMADKGVLIKNPTLRQGKQKTYDKM
jgi:hypothetical protein